MKLILHISKSSYNFRFIFRLSDEQTSPGIDGCERYFVHPFVQAWAMTFGECGLLLTYTVMFYCRKDKKEEVRKSFCDSISFRLRF